MLWRLQLSAMATTTPSWHTAKARMKSSCITTNPCHHLGTFAGNGKQTANNANAFTKATQQWWQPEEVAAVGGPVLLGNVLNSEQAIAVLPVLVFFGQDRQPG